MYCIALLQYCPPGLRKLQFCGNSAKPHCRGIVPLISPALSSSWVLLHTTSVRTKEHLAPNQTCLITCYGNFHNTSIKRIGQNSISPSATDSMCCSIAHHTVCRDNEPVMEDCREAFLEWQKVGLENSLSSPSFQARSGLPSWRIQKISGHSCQNAFPKLPCCRLLLDLFTTDMRKRILSFSM